MGLFDTTVEILSFTEWFVFLLLFVFLLIAIVLYICMFRLDQMPTPLFRVLRPLLDLDSVAHCSQ